MEENYFMEAPDYEDPRYDPNTDIAPTFNMDPEFYDDTAPKTAPKPPNEKIEELKGIIYTACRRSGLGHEVSTKMANTFHYPVIASMIAGSTSLVFLSGFLGISAFSSLALLRINELKKRELNQNPSKKKSIEAKYKKVLNQTYKPPKKK